MTCRAAALLTGCTSSLQYWPTSQLQQVWCGLAAYCPLPAYKPVQPAATEQPLSTAVPPLQSAWLILKSFPEHVDALAFMNAVQECYAEEVHASSLH